MSTVIVNTFLTLDGVAQAPGGPEEDTDSGFTHGGWQVPFFTDQLGAIIGPWFANPGALLLGRRTYDIFAGYWPHIAADHGDAAIAKILNETTKYVASRTVTSVDWENSHLLDADVPKAVAKLKKQDLGEIQVHGSLDLVQTLIEHDLVDEYRLTVFPVVLGTGKRLFGDGTVPGSLALVSAQSTDAGVVACVYRRAGEVRYGSHM
jgi:dihydrofolate reductase